MPDFTLAIPSNSTTLAIETRVQKAQFSDGYEQRQPDGPNAVRNVWSVDFSPIASTTVASIDTFLRGKGGSTSFTWLNPDGATERVVCEKWNRNFQGGNTWGLTAEFRQVFEP